MPDDFFDGSVSALPNSTADGTSPLTPSDAFAAASPLNDPLDFFLDSPVGVRWDTWGDTAYTFDQINQAGLVTFADFD